MQLKRHLNIWPIIKKSKILRSLNLLIGLMVLLMLTLTIANFNYRGNIKANQEEIEKNLTLYQGLQAIVQSDTQDLPSDDVLLKKSFADYDEVVPFIAFLESLFSVIDSESEVVIKSKERQIFIDHFADYSVHMEISEGKKDLLYKAFDELEQSRFIINILNFATLYKPTGDEGLNRLSEVELNIRLFLK